MDVHCKHVGSLHGSSCECPVVGCQCNQSRTVAQDNDHSVMSSIMTGVVVASAFADTPSSSPDPSPSSDFGGGDFGGGGATGDY